MHIIIYQPISYFKIMKKLISLVLLMMVIVVGCTKDEPVISEYIVTFNTQGGNNIEALKVSEGMKVTKPQDPTKENYIFSGWYKDAKHTAAWDFDKDVVNGDITLYAKWVEVARACTVTFDSQGGSEVASKTVNKGEKLVKPTDPTLENRSFLGWYKNAACTSEWNFDKDVVNGDITLYARWSEVGETVYTVTFDTDGGNEIDPVSVKADETVTEPATPAKLGYKFGGWYSDAAKQSEYDFNTPVTNDITLYAKWEKAEFALTDFDIKQAAQEVTWDADTKTLDISKATGSVTLSFNVVGALEVTNDATHKYDTYARSIGGTEQLKEIVKVVGTVDGKIGMEVMIPNQSPKVPLDIEVVITDAGNPNAKDVITIKSRPDYDDTGIQPVLMKTEDNKLVFWAPVNVGATEIPTSVIDAILGIPDGTNVITPSCGQLFQWGRKYGFENTIDETYTNEQAFDGATEEPGYPKGEEALKNMKPWDGRFILETHLFPATRGNWFLFDAGGAVNNPDDSGMIDGEWYQKLWNQGTEDSPVKTDYDPCPAGWRVPTRTEWEAIGADNNSVTNDWDKTKGLLTIAGAESDQKLILPAAGYRLGSTGTFGRQGSFGNCWSSSVPSGSVYASYVVFYSATLSTFSDNRANGLSVRCIQE